MGERSREHHERAANAFDRLIGNLANAGVTTWVAQATGSPESGAAIGAMAAPIGEELSFATRQLLDIRKVRAEALVDSASEQAGMSADLLLVSILKDVSKVELLARAITASERSSTELKIALLGQHLATGAISSDDTIVDESTMAIDAIGAIDRPHLRMLVVLVEPSPVWRESGSERELLRFAWPEPRIIQQDPGLAGAFHAVAAKLRALGMVTSVPSASGEGELWELTSFGRFCLRSLAEHINSRRAPAGGSDE